MLSTRSPIVIRNVTRTKSLSKKSLAFATSILPAISTSSASGGLISILQFSIEDNEVAELPIIWFIASQMAEKCSSVSSGAGFNPSPPIIRSVMTFTSSSFKISTLFPSIPSLYRILINTHGFAYSAVSLSQFVISTTGVVITTFWFTSEYSVVAAVPIQILEISPIASFSSSESMASLLVWVEEEPVFIFPSNALISS